MIRGGKILCSAAAVAVVACAGPQGKLEIRPTSTALAASGQPLAERIADARGQLALGNVGLALESFRKAAREDPTSTDALLGIAVSYDQMGRFDLSRRNYEAALALAPGDVRLLEAFAESLSGQGLSAEAASVRQEIATRRAAPAPAAVAVAGIQTLEPPVALERPVASELPVAALTPSAMQDTSALPKGQQLASLSVPVVHIEAPQVAVPPTPPAAPAPEPATPQPVKPIETARAEIGRSVTITLPPPRPIAAEPARAQPPVAEPVEVAQRVVVAQRGPAKDGPRLERLSLGEVALITSPGPFWRSAPVRRTAQSTTVRFVPLRTAAQTARIRLLNAARVHRLAARTRSHLDGRGWRSVSIGDAEKTRARSLILYPADQRSVALRLSRHFGFATAPSSKVRQVTVLLGRDAARMDRTRRG